MYSSITPRRSVCKLVALRAHLHAGLDRRRARGRIALAFDLDQAQAARAERFQRIRRAELRHVDAGLDSGAHDRRAGRHRDCLAVDLQRRRRCRRDARGAVVGVVEVGARGARSCLRLRFARAVAGAAAAGRSVEHV